MATPFTNLRIFWQSAYLSYKALFRWFSPISYASSKVIMPLFQLIFFTFLGTFATGIENAPFFLIGNSVLAVAINGIYGVSMTVGMERRQGTLPYLFGTPANRLFLFSGRAVVHIFDGMVGAGISLLAAVLIFRLDLSAANPLAFALTVLITSASTAAMGLLLGSLSLVTLNVMFFNNTIYFLLLVLAGVNLPLEMLPGWARIISQGLPLTRGLAAARMIVAGSGIGDVWWLLVQELGIGAIYFTIGYVAFSIFEREAKKRGTLEAY